MSSPPPANTHRSSLTPRAVLVAVGMAVLVLHAGSIGYRRTTHAGDFDVSREFGRRLVAGEPLYAGGLHYPYMPTAALFFAPLALLPAPLAFALRYAVALGALWYVVRRMHGLVAARDPASAARGFALAVLTLGLASHYVLRDLDDGGPHLILLAFLVAGIGAAERGREVAAAGWFGLAAALKAPNALLLPFLIWKRNWRLTGLTAAAIALWAALPMLWMGPGPWWRHQAQWFVTATASAVGQATGGEHASEARPQNQSLRATVARLCARAPMEPTCPHPAAAALAASIAVVGLLMWWTRRARHGPTDPAWPYEASAVLIASLLLSPVTWVQHLVLLIPALYLVVATLPARGAPVSPRSAAIACGLAIYALLAIVLNRELLGRERYLALLGDGLHTWCMLLVLALLIGSARPREAA